MFFTLDVEFKWHNEIIVRMILLAYYLSHNHENILSSYNNVFGKENSQIVVVNNKIT